MKTYQLVLVILALIFAVVSVGIWIWNVNNAKKIKNQTFVPKPEKYKKQKFPFKLDVFINDLGGIENIKETTATIHKIKIILVDDTKINLDSLKKIKNNGIILQTNVISLALGNYCFNLSKTINELVALNQEK